MGGSEYRLLSPPSIPRLRWPEQGTEPQLLPGHHSINGCLLLRGCVHMCVCVHCCVYALGWVNLEPNSEYGSPYLAVCHVPLSSLEQYEWFDCARFSLFLFQKYMKSIYICIYRFLYI